MTRSAEESALKIYDSPQAVTICIYVTKDTGENKYVV